MIALDIVLAWSPATWIRLSRTAPYSSPVLSLSVLIFQLLTSFLPRKRPTAIVVLPTSKAKSISVLLVMPRRGRGRRRGRPCPPRRRVRPRAGRPRRGRGRCRANVPAAVVTRMGRPAGKAILASNVLDDQPLVSPGEGIIPAVERPAKAVENGLDRHRPAADDPEGGRRRAKVGGEVRRTVTDVDADPDDGEIPGRSAGDALGQDAPELFPVVDEVVRPLEQDGGAGRGQDRVRQRPNPRRGAGGEGREPGPPPGREG